MKRARWSRAGLEAFLFPKEDDRWLTALRIGLGLQLALTALFLWHDWTTLFASAGNGILGRQVSETMSWVQSPLLPRLSWLVTAGQWAGLNERAALEATRVAMLAVGANLMLGFSCRLTALAAWFLQLCFAKSGSFLSYGVDNLVTIGLFYLVWAPLPDRFALDARIWPRSARDPRISGFFRRVLQLHLCVIYFFGGLAKCLGNGWWNGDNIWRALTHPPFDVLPAELIARFYWALPPLGISICLIEIGYPFFIWPKRTRLLWLGLACGMHAAIAVTMGMHLFALIMIVLNLAAFGVRGPLGRRSRPTERVPAAA